MNKKIFFLWILFNFFFGLAREGAVLAESNPKEYYEVYRVIDGDTFVLRNEERVRLLGVDAPEAINSPKLHRDARKLGVKISSVKAMGLESKSYLESLIRGKKVRFEFDNGGLTRDHNGRILAYVYLEDGTFVNAELLREGYAALLDVSEKSSGRYRSLFYEMQNEAIARDRGQWQFISRRVEQLFQEASLESLSFDQRREVLDYINQLRNGKVHESYIPVSLSSGSNSPAEPPVKTQKTDLPQTAVPV